MLSAIFHLVADVLQTASIIVSAHCTLCAYFYINKFPLLLFFSPERLVIDDDSYLITKGVTQHCSTSVISGHSIATTNTARLSFYPRTIRIWNMIPPNISEIENPIAFQAAIMNLPFTTPSHLNCL